jgi:predicted CopG family antitoxin
MSTKPRPNALDAIKLAAQGAAAPQVIPELAPAAAGMPKGDTMTTAIHIRREHWELLRRAAFTHAMKHGGRASVSAVLTDLIERHRDELEAQAAGD